MRVLHIIETCNPEWVSVPLEGWSLSRALAEHGETHIATQVRNRDALKRAGLVEGKDFSSIDSEILEARMYQLAAKFRGGTGKGWTTLTGLTAFSYFYFEYLVWKQFGRRIEAGEFDFVHRITPLSPTNSSLIAPWCHHAGVPFVLGPLNGGVPWPSEFNAARHKENEWLSYIRDIYKLMPGYHSTRRAAAAIIIGSRDTWRQVPANYRRKCVYIPENAIEQARFTKRRTRRASNPLRTVFIGRLVPYKGADMLIEAAAPLVRDGKLTVEIIGDGPQMGELKELVARQQVGSGITLAGWVEHSKLQDRLIQADLFTFPSIREFGGAVVLEAMAVGLVPVVIDYGGPAELVTERSGWKIPIGSRADIIAGLQNLLRELVASPAQIDAKSDAAYTRSHTQFTWSTKAKQIVAVYDWIRDPSRPKPFFGMPLPDIADGQ
ncbi:MAG TPA: glycosyltransferase family 4 protein [Tepidisphaeraceae bacterium]|nr:glycosyltransferase family 4 protein [Tepidisphaeraceae bacterium]